jgi:SAM-dependent methyltransferase
LEPSSLLIDALAMLTERTGRALDIGAGPLNDTRFLLRAGFAVDAVDHDPVILSLASKINERQLNAIHGDIRDLRIARESYTIAVAIHVLPFLLRSDLVVVISSIIDGLVDGGVLCCTLLGADDSWAAQRPRMTFLSRSEIDTLFSPLRWLACSELRYIGTDAQEQPKHWHVFRCILRKYPVPEPGRPDYRRD